MNIIQLSCTSCGAPISVPPDLDQFTCVYCGASLTVQRGEGYIALKLSEKIAQSIEFMGEKTQNSIREGAQITQTELRRLQIHQEIASLQNQLGYVQAEIRALERSKKTRQSKRQLEELMLQKSNYLRNLQVLQSSLSSSSLSDSKIQISASESNRKKESLLQSQASKSCVSGCVTYFLIFGLAFYLPGLFSNLSSGSTANFLDELDNFNYSPIGYAAIIIAIIDFIYYHVNSKPIYIGVFQFLFGKMSAKKQSETLMDPKPEVENQDQSKI